MDDNRLENNVYTLDDDELTINVFETCKYLNSD